MLDLDAELEEYIGLHSEPEPEILQQLSLSLIHIFRNLSPLLQESSFH